LPGWSQENRLIKSGDKTAWEELDRIKDSFRAPKSGSSFIEIRQLEDSEAKRKSDLASAFLTNFPNSPYYDEVLTMYFHPTFRPYFIKDSFSDSHGALLQQLQLQLKNADSPDLKARHFAKLERLLVRDDQAFEHWLQFGQSLVANRLASNISPKHKLDLELRLLNRDTDLALSRYQALDKDPKEYSFWERFDAEYWKPYLVRVEGLLKRYPDSESIASFIKNFISFVVIYSPSLEESYWKHFLGLTSTDSTFSDQIAFVELHDLAVENIAALTALKTADPNSPLKMRFIDLHGNIIDLDSLKGKVVLIDFWSIRCLPCIQEMPYVVELYNKYRNQGLEVIGIVAEGDAACDAVLKITAKAKAPWPQSLDKGKLAKISYQSLFNVTSFPTLWLLNKEGKVVDKNARGARLEPLIRENLGLEQLKFDYTNPSF
ncbi:MAG: TlpA disulfide reductase family protein, partial [Ginsengibacter sp.]